MIGELDYSWPELIEAKGIAPDVVKRIEAEVDRGRLSPETLMLFRDWLDEGNGYYTLLSLASMEELKLCNLLNDAFDPLYKAPAAPDPDDKEAEKASEALPETASDVSLAKAPEIASEAVPEAPAGSWARFRQNIDRMKQAAVIEAEAVSGAFTPETMTKIAYFIRSSCDDGDMSKFSFSDVPEPDIGLASLIYEAMRPRYEADGLQMPAAPKGRPFIKVRTAKELQRQEIPPTQWIVRDMIAEGNTCILAAPRKTGKSFMCIDLALKVCEGKPFMKHQTKQCSVLYCDLESTEARPQSRVNILTAGEAAPDGLLIAVKGEINSIGKGFEEQIREYHRACHVKLVIVDVFSKITPARPRGADAYEYSYQMMDKIMRLASELGIAFILVMHCRKSSAFSGSGDPFDEIIGSTGYVSAADAMMMIQKDYKTGEYYFHSIGRDIEGEDLQLEYKGCRWSVVGDMETVQLQRQSEAFRESPVVKTILSLIRQGSGEWAGSAGEVITASKYLAKEISDDASRVGRFIENNKGFFWTEYNISVEPFRSNGKRGFRFTKKASEASANTEE